jgi:ubiquinone/menaquinone biosynthesis C-methylase UbiE
MTTLTRDTETLEQIRQHFNKAPYPNIPIETYPKNQQQLYIHSLTTAFYRRDRRFVSPQGKMILDAGCGTGYKSLELAIANPGATIVGVDISEDSVVMAQQRMAYHKVQNCQFHAIPLEQITQLGLQFDYINCDDVLYILPDPTLALKMLGSVLKADGMIRANYHSNDGRRPFQIAQQFFQKLGCMQGTPDQSEIELVRQTMSSLNENVSLKITSWGPAYMERDELVLANHLLQNDKSWSISDFFATMRAANLEFFSMVDWWTWDVLDLFDIDNMPLDLMMRLSELSIEDQLSIYESVHIRHRLLDLWCGHPQQESLTKVPGGDEWQSEDWFRSTVYFHPQVLTDALKTDLIDCASTGKMLNTAGHFPTTTALPETMFIDSLTAGCLLALAEGGQSFQNLLTRWMHLRPINPVNMEPTEPEEAFEPLTQVLTKLETMGYILLERAPE